MMMWCGGAFGAPQFGSCINNGIHDVQDLPRLLGRPYSAIQAIPGPFPDVSEKKEKKEKEKEKEATQDSSLKGSISMLQEFVQCSKEYRLPPRHPIVQWTFETRMQDYSTLEFQAVASFLFAGAPHHIAGAWHQSKKSAQRDTAERALALLVGRWGEHLLQEKLALEDKTGEEEETDTTFSRQSSNSCTLSTTEDGGSPPTSPAKTDCSFEVADMDKGPYDIQMYAKLISEHPACDKAVPTWQSCFEDGKHRVFLEIEVLGVPHKFAGPPCADECEAYSQTARRVLWYLQQAGFETAYEPDMSPSAAALISQPPRWTRDAAEEDTLQLAERKTAVMRIQNRLQRGLSHELKPGQTVWEWSYETDREDGGWPPLCRATVRLAVFGVEFTGDWVRSHRGAQLDTCAYVANFLDQLDAKAAMGKCRSRSLA